MDKIHNHTNIEWFEFIRWINNGVRRVNKGDVIQIVEEPKDFYISSCEVSNKNPRDTRNVYKFEMIDVVNFSKEYGCFKVLPDSFFGDRADIMGVGSLVEKIRDEYRQYI